VRLMICNGHESCELDRRNGPRKTTVRLGTNRD
jgi:hypothetical protein